MKIIKKIKDEVTGINKGFVTEYPDNDYISKTIVYGHETNDLDEVVEQGRITVVMRNGQHYTFDCMATTVYCGQFGITVSNNGMYVYIISDEVGLWCYTYQGVLKWKTRYTSIGHVIENDNRTIMCISSTKLLLLDENGQKIKERKIVSYQAEKASKNVIYASITANTVALIDCQSLEVLWQSSLKKIGLEKSRYALIYDRYLIIKGERTNGQIAFKSVLLLKSIYENSRYDATLTLYYGFDNYLKGDEFKNVVLSE